MSPSRYVGSWPVRIATAIVTAVYAILLVARPLRFPRALLVVGAMLLLSGLAHSFKSLYPRWTRFTDAIPRVLIAFFFLLVYFLVLPLFAIISRLGDPLGLRPRRSSWISGDDRPLDRDSLKSMG